MKLVWIRSWAVIALGLPIVAAAQPFRDGEVFAGLPGGEIVRHDARGAVTGSLRAPSGGQMTGMCFDAEKHLYATDFTAQTVARFSPDGRLLDARWASGFGGKPESCVVDASGRVYVGTVEPARAVYRFDASGRLEETFHPRPVGSRGMDWIDLAADQCTLFYTSEGPSIGRFDVCTGEQRRDLARVGGECFALRVRGNGEVMVACGPRVYRLSPSGQVLQRYEVPGERLFGLNLDRDGRTFWTGGVTTANVYRIDIASGAGTDRALFNAAGAPPPPPPRERRRPRGVFEQLEQLAKDFKESLETFSGSERMGGLAVFGERLAAVQAKVERTPEPPARLPEKENDLARRQLEDARAQARQELEEARVQAEKELEEARVQAEKELEEARIRAREELEQARTRAEEEMEEARTQAEKELEGARTQAEKELEDARTQADQELQEARTQAEESLPEAPGETPTPEGGGEGRAASVDEPAPPPSGVLDLGVAEVEGFARLAGRSSVESSLQLPGLHVEGSGVLRLTTDLDLDRVELAVFAAGGWQALGREPIEVSVGSTSGDAWRLRLTAGECPGHPGASRPKIFLEADRANGPPLRLAVPLDLDLVPDPWLHCWWPLLAIPLGLLLTGLTVHGFVTPSRFPRRAGLILASEENLTEGFFHPLRGQKGSGSGFYRDARLYLREDFRFTKRPGGAWLRLRAEGNRLRVKPVGGTVWRQGATGEWEEVGEAESILRPGVAHRNDMATIYFEYRQG